MHLYGCFSFFKSKLFNNSEKANYKYNSTLFSVTSDNFQLNCSFIKHEAVSVTFFRTKNRITEKFELINLKSPGHQPSLCPGDFSLLSFKEILRQSLHQPECFIWLDEDKMTLYIARDTFGLIPLYFLRTSENALAFSTNIGSLIKFRDPIHSRTVNYSRIHSYFKLSDVNSAYNSDTYYPDITSILPSHFVSFTKDHLEFNSYVDYNPDKYQHLKNVVDYGKTFKELLLKSVDKSTRDASVIGAQLSGGLDSSSVVASARLLKPESKFHTFHFRTDDSLNNEEYFGQQVADLIRSEHQMIGAKYNTIDFAINMIAFNAQPLYALGPIGFTVDSIDKAVQNNCDILLTGYDGDSIVGYGTKNYLLHLFKQKDWNSLEVATSDLALHNHYAASNPYWDKWGHSRKTFLLLRHQFYSELKKSLNKLSFKNSAEILYSGFHHFNIPPHDLLRRIGKDIIRKIGSKAVVSYSFLNDSVSAEVLNDQSRELSFRNTLKEKNLMYHEKIMVNQNIRILEDFFFMSQLHKLSIRHPFFDRDLYELNLAVPSVIKFDHGFERGQLREAMKGILPETVRTRTSKSSGNLTVLKSTLLLYNEARDLLHESAEVWKFVNHEKFKKGIKLLESKNNDSLDYSTMGFNVNRTIYLAIWLDLYKRNAFTIHV